VDARFVIQAGVARESINTNAYGVHRVRTSWSLQQHFDFIMQ